ncbi:MAG: hypothetical protein WD887_01175 [Candidatus Saccharimonadales bacterium]
MSLSIKRILIAVTAGAFIVTVGSPTFAITHKARAEEARQNAQQLRENAQATANERKEAVKAEVEERREAAKTRLEAAKLRACQNREKAIQNIMARINDRGEKHIVLFTKIADRVKAFYVDKGLTADNYDELVAQVEVKKAAAEAAVASLQSSDVQFKCDSEDPKGTALVFKDLLKQEIDALKAYRTAVKNLIVAVAQAQKAATTEEGAE